MAINMILFLEQALLKVININWSFPRHTENTRDIVVVEFLTEILPLRVNFTKYTKLIKVQDFTSYSLLNH
jgi:hypothetical protein